MTTDRVLGLSLAVFALISGFGCWGEKWFLFNKNYENRNF